MDYAFSIDGEEWHAEDPHGNKAETEAQAVSCAISRMMEYNDEPPLPGDVVEIGPKIPHKASDFYSIDDILENMGERAYDECGECAEDFPDLSKEESAELDKLISDYLEAHALCTFWTVEKITKHEITAEEIAGCQPADETT